MRVSLDAIRINLGTPAQKMPATRAASPASPPPWKLGCVLMRTGTLDGTDTLVMADEAMANALAKQLQAASAGKIKSAEVVSANTDLSCFDLLFFLHHLPDVLAAIEHLEIPAWLWVHNPGYCSPLEIERRNGTTYVDVFHAGRKTSEQMGLTFFEHALEDEMLFRPNSTTAGTLGIVFVGNAVMHADFVPVLARLSGTPGFSLYGTGWELVGIPSGGQLPYKEAPRILAAASVCLDHVTGGHVAEGMTSTRIYQALACGAPCVTMQPRENIPADLHPHIVFASDNTQAIQASLALLGDPIARVKMAKGAREAALRHTMKRRAREIWKHMMEKMTA